MIFVMPAQDKHSSHIRSTTQINLLAYKLTKTNNRRRHQLTNSQAYKLTNSKAHQLANSQAHQLKNLNRYLLFYNNALVFAPF